VVFFCWGDGLPPTPPAPAPKISSFFDLVFLAVLKIGIFLPFFSWGGGKKWFFSPFFSFKILL
jgi:hypothetical protein